MHMLKQPRVVCVYHMSTDLGVHELLFELSTWEYA